MFRVSVILPLDRRDELLDRILNEHVSEVENDLETVGSSPETARDADSSGEFEGWALGRYLVDRRLICLEQGFIEHVNEYTMCPEQAASSPSVVVFWDGPDKLDDSLLSWWAACDMLIVHRSIREEFMEALEEAPENKDRLVVGFGDEGPSTRESREAWWIKTDRQASFLEQIDGAIRCCCIGLDEIDSGLPAGVQKVKPYASSLHDILKEKPHHIVLVDDKKGELDKLQKALQDFTYDDGRPFFIHFIHMEGGIGGLADKVAELFFRYSHCDSFTVLLDSFYGKNNQQQIDEQLVELEERYPWFGIVVFTDKDDCTEDTICNFHPIGVAYDYKPWGDKGTLEDFLGEFKKVLEVGMLKIAAARKMKMFEEVISEECSDYVIENNHGREDDRIVAEHIDRIIKHREDAHPKLIKLLNEAQEYNTDKKNYLMPEDDDSLEITALKIKELTTRKSKNYSKKIRSIFGFPEGEGIHLYKCIYDMIKEKVDESQLFLHYDKLKEIWKKKTGLDYDNCKKRWTEGFLESGVIGCTKKLNDSNSEEEIIGHSQLMMDLKGKIDTVAKTNSTVLVTGESGTGKELVAKALHKKSSRSNNRWKAINCAALLENLMEPELFGYQKGSHSTAEADKEGIFQFADKGTLFLDEIGELPLPMQAKLLRVLDEQVVQPLGSTADIKVDVRVVAGTNRDLLGEVEEKRFRLDLYHRLKVVSLHVPPLRERNEDIPELVRYFLRQYNKKFNKNVKPPTRKDMAILTSHTWPGNVRELKNYVENEVNLRSGGTHMVLPTSLSRNGYGGEGRLERLTKRVIEDCFQQENGSEERVANRLKIRKNMLKGIMKKFKIDPKPLSH